MSSRRRSFGRILVVAALLLLALLLLELERFLPGSWPGGGGDRGSRSFPTGSKPDPSRLVPSTTPPPPPKPPSDVPTIRVVLRRADGTPVDAATVRAGDGGRDVADATEDGEVRLPATAAVGNELVVTTRDGTKVSHGRAPAGGEGTWIVVLPRQAPPGERDGAKLGAAARSVRVVDAAGRPVAGASVTATGRGGEQRVDTRPDGTAAFGADDGVRRFCVAATGFGDACVYGRLEAGRPLVVRLSPSRPRRTTFTDPTTGAPLEARSLRLVDRRGNVRRLERETGAFDRFETTMPDDVAEAMDLEIDVAGRPPIRVPMSALAERTAVPEGRARSIRVTDDAGAPVEGAVVTARFPAGDSYESREAAPLEVRTATDAAGRATLALPTDRDADVVVEAKDLVVAGVRLGSRDADPSAPVEVTTSRGTDVRVRIADERGLPVAGADVLALSAADRSTARRQAATDAKGEATIAGVRADALEILAHKPGFAWASVGVTGAAGAYGAAPIAITLRAGRRLALVVEDPTGVPLAGVKVRSVARADAAAGVPDPTDPDGVPWETDAHGVLLVDDLPDREVDLYLTKAGYAEEIVARVRPSGATWFATMVPTKR